MTGRLDSPVEVQKTEFGSSG